MASDRIASITGQFRVQGTVFQPSVNIALGVKKGIQQPVIHLASDIINRISTGFRHFFYVFRRFYFYFYRYHIILFK